MARLLIEAGARVDHATNNGATSLFAAAYHEKRAVARLLLEHGASAETALAIDDPAGSQEARFDAAAELIRECAAAVAE